jgi:hypothetical protein
MKQIHITNNEAPKLRGDGMLTYQLWVDDCGSLYVQVEANAAAGKFSALVYPVTKYAAQRNSNQSIGKPVGFDLEGGAERTSENNDDGGFLKAVLRHLLDGGASA